MADIWRVPYAARKELWDAVGYKPSDLQLKAHLDPHRLKQIAGGERAGKSFWTAHEIATWLTLTTEKDLIWIVGPSYELARPEMQHLLECYGGIGWVNASTAQMPANGQWTMWSANGTKIETKTSTEVRRLAGVAPAGIAQVEAAQQEYESYLRCRGRVAQKRGPLILSGTFEGSRNYYADLWRSWQVEGNPEGGKSFSLPTWGNLALFPGGRDDPEIKMLESSLPPDVFSERYSAIPLAPSNLVLREFDPQVHVRPCPYDPALPVQVWVDPGYSGAYAVSAIQIHGREVWNIDEVYEQATVVHDIIDICKEREWWKGVTHGVCDIAGRQHHGDISQVEIWGRYAGIKLFTQSVPILAGIIRHRTFLRDPSTGYPLLFHDPKCVSTIKEYSLYVYPKARERRNESELPIDQYNHCIVGDTLIDTPTGKHKIADLVGQEPYVYCFLDGKVAVRKASNIHLTMKAAQVVKVVMDKGVLICTPDHKIMCADGQYVEAKDLEAGQRLKVISHVVDMKHGYVHVHMTDQPQPAQLEHRVVAEGVYGAIPSGYHVHHKDGNKANQSPDNLEILPKHEHLSHDSLGSWSKNYNERSKIVRKNIELAHQANIGRPITEEQKRKLGEASRRMWEKEGFREAIRAKRVNFKHSPESIQKMKELKQAFWDSEEGQKRKELIRSQRNDKGQFTSTNHKVECVIPFGTADVYDMTVDEAHNFVANDVVISNSLKAIAYGLCANFGTVDRPPLGDVSVSFRRG